ncbi:unnamed protein product [Rhizoctonia solani]|uniref:Transmembrane protein n=1 Tax=Rhizoctonia solani TaxID=456999 RepID=A0A8H3C320_9AGAM|nr:unnamed protein product [Rhizoctonia solani]
MIPLPFLEYNLSHPHPKGHWFLLATVIVFIVTLPLLVLVNFATLGFQVVPSLQTEFRANAAPLQGWWGSRRLPPLLRPSPPRCQPKELGRGDSFRLTGSLFDYSVMSTWRLQNDTGPKVPEQQRVEYHGESFASCYANAVRYDYSLSDQSHTMTVGVECPGSSDYAVYVSMQTAMTFAFEATKDFIGQYYGPGLDLGNLPQTSDYRKVVLATLEVLASDTVSIFRKPLLAAQPQSIRVYWPVDSRTAMIDDASQASTLTYSNGSQPDPFPEEAFLYIQPVYNLVYAAIDAVNLDLGNNRSSIFNNASRLNEVIFPNRPPTSLGINATGWALPGKTFYYGTIPPPYVTWAEALLNNTPVTTSELTGLHNRSVMSTTYLCPTYEVKPTSALLTSVFVGSATMTLSVWGAWMFFTAFLARKIMAPQVICHCDDCKARREREAIRIEEARRRAANLQNAGIIGRLMALMGVERRQRSPPSNPSRDVETANVHTEAYGLVPYTGRPDPTPVPDEKHASYLSTSTHGRN